MGRHQRRYLRRHHCGRPATSRLGARSTQRTYSRPRTWRERRPARTAGHGDEEEPRRDHRARASQAHRGVVDRHGSAAELRSRVRRIVSSGVCRSRETVQGGVSPVPAREGRRRSVAQPGRRHSSQHRRRPHPRRQRLGSAEADGGYGHGCMIELHGVSKTVPSGEAMLTILHPLDLRIEAGTVAAIVGPSGSGKSTLLGLLAGLDNPSTGLIVIDGADITTMSEDDLARFRGRRIGFVFQFFHLLPSLTAYENVRVPLEIAGKPDPGARADALLSEVGLGPRRHHYPSQLSGGEQQRVAIARALANDPAILLADEPTRNLATAPGRQVIDLLIEANRRRRTTVVLVTHDRELAQLADVTVALRDGRIASTAERQAAPAS